MVKNPADPTTLAQDIEDQVAKRQAVKQGVAQTMLLAEIDVSVTVTCVELILTFQSSIDLLYARQDPNKSFA
jgi:hypothetical protein